MAIGRLRIGLTASLVAATAVGLGTGAFAQGAFAQGARRVEGERTGAQAAVPPVVRLAIRTARTLRYSGRRTVEFLSGADRKVHVEFVLKDGPRSRVWFPSDSPFAGQVIVEKGGKRTHYFPGRDAVETSTARGEEALARFVEMIKNARRMRITVRPGGQVAGVKTQEAAVQDPSGNVVQRLWIDPDTGMILKRELYDRVGSKVGSFEFQTINYRPVIQPGDFEIARAGARRLKMRDRLLELSKDSGMVPYALEPAGGYNLIAARVLGKNRNAATLVQTYRGPKGALTLFQTKAPIDAQRLKRLGADRYQSYTWKLDGVNFALVGDLSVAELRRVAGLVAGL
jgi:outer membrane lipoprotein-sorting protein